MTRPSTLSPEQQNPLASDAAAKPRQAQAPQNMAAMMGIDEGTSVTPVPLPPATAARTR